MALKTLRLSGLSPEKLLGLDQRMKAVSQVSELAGKSVRLTYVDGISGLIDPGLLAQTAGELVLERAPDHLVSGRTCRRLQVASGRLRFQNSTETHSQIGHFDPEGSLDYSSESQIIVAAKLRGRARLDQVSKNHLLFEARMRQEPELEMQYTCRIVDTLKRP